MTKDFNHAEHAERAESIIPLKTKAVITIAAFQLRRLGLPKADLKSKLKSNREKSKNAKASVELDN